LSSTDATTPKRPLRQDLADLIRMPRELWLVLIAKFLEYVGVFTLLFVLTLWLSKDLGMDDVGAGWWSGLFSLLASIFAFVTGFVADSVGFRRSLVISFACSMVARAMMSLSHARPVALAGLLILALGIAGATPSMNAALRRYTTPTTRSFAFALYYTAINVGGFAAGFIVDACRHAFRDPATNQQIFKNVHLPLLGDVRMSAYSMVFFVGFGCSIVALAVGALLRGDIDAEKIEAARNPEAAAALASEAAPTEERAKKPPWAIAWELAREKAFWRFMLLMGLLAFVKLIFQHYHFTWPKYVLREYGETFPMGAFQSVNPIIIIFLVPIVTAFTRHRSAFNCIVLGSFITSLCAFVLCLPPKTIHAPFPFTYPVILGSILFLSFGEALWSPRSYEYAASVAPKGREASYLGLQSLPFFFAKMMAGPASGYLLMQYCPENGPRHAAVLWLFIGGTTLAAPILMVIFRSVIEGRSRAPTSTTRDEAPAEAA
jgi:dipeptide/tripeptide permease